MDSKSIEIQIQKNLIREGTLRKRSKFLKEWRDRWVVLTANFLFTFTTKKKQEMTDVVEIKEIQGIKSYLKKSDDMTPNGFKVQSSENTLILMAKDKQEKWSWIVTLERLLDFKSSKQSSESKTIQDVRGIGFLSLNQYEEKSKEEKTEQNKQKQKQEEQGQSENLKSVIKMIQLFKSQQQQNIQLLQQCRNHSKKALESLPESEEIKSLDSKMDELCKSLDHPEIAGIVKGMLICKKMSKQSPSQLPKILQILIKDSKSEKVGNWSAQLKQNL